MKKTVFLFTLSLAIIFSASSQSGSHKVQLYDSWYYLKSTSTLLNPQFRAFTYAINDSSVTIVDREVYMFNMELSPEDLRIIPAGDINTIKFRRKGSITLGVGVGVTGVIIGGIVGALREGDPWQKPFQVITGVLVGGVIGFAVGIPLSSIKTTFHIGGDVKNYREQRLRMIKYSIRYYTD